MDKYIGHGSRAMGKGHKFELSAHSRSLHEAEELADDVIGLSLCKPVFETARSSNSLHETCLKHANNWYRLLGNIDININFWCCLRLIEE